MDTFIKELAAFSSSLSITEGGRLEKELAYTQKSLGEMESTTHQLLIQTPKNADASVLHPQALLTHLKVLEKATSIQIDMFDTTWSLRDMCNVPTTPQFDLLYIEQIFEGLIPCSIITPLDCFWEGSKLLGPKYSPTIPYVYFYEQFSIKRILFTSSADFFHSFF